MAFKTVELLQNHGGDDDVVLLESFQAVGRVKDDVGIKDEVFQSGLLSE